MALLDKLRELHREYDRLVRDALKTVEVAPNAWRNQYREHLDFDTRQALEEAIKELQAGADLSEMVDRFTDAAK